MWMGKGGGKCELGMKFRNMVWGKFGEGCRVMEGRGDEVVKCLYVGCVEYMRRGRE